MAPTMRVICRNCGTVTVVPVLVTPDPVPACPHHAGYIVSIDPVALRPFVDAHLGPFVAA